MQKFIYYVSKILKADVTTASLERLFLANNGHSATIDKVVVTENRIQSFKSIR